MDFFLYLGYHFVSIDFRLSTLMLSCDSVVGRTEIIKIWIGKVTHKILILSVLDILSRNYLTNSSWFQKLLSVVLNFNCDKLKNWVRNNFVSL